MKIKIKVSLLSGELLKHYGETPGAVITITPLDNLSTSSVSGSKLWRCTGCDVTGPWNLWKSSWEPSTHQCDVCALNGKKASLCPTS